MKEYPHIDTIWARDMTNKGRIVEGAFTAPEFAYLAENRWIGTEKVDGTNVRVMWDGFPLRFGGDGARVAPVRPSRPDHRRIR